MTQFQPKKKDNSYRTLKPLGYRHERRQPKVVVVEGFLSSNPGVGYKRCAHCQKRKGSPQLVLTHHSQTQLSLWFCEGCPSVLIRLDRENCDFESK